MKKFIVTLLIGAISMPLYAQTDAENSAQNQNQTEQTKQKKKPSKFGNFIRRVGESATGIDMSKETFVVLPLEVQPMAEVKVASCVGEKETGDVMLVLTVTPKIALKTSPISEDCTAADNAQGKYKGRLDDYKNDAKPVGVPVEFLYFFKDVSTAAPQFEEVVVPYYFATQNNAVGSNMSKYQPMQVRNVPIEWRSIAAENGSYVDFADDPERWAGLEIESCVGDRKSGVVTFTFVPSAKQELRWFRIPSDEKVTAVDDNNVSYRGVVVNKPKTEAFAVGEKTKVVVRFAAVPTTLETIKSIKSAFDVGNKQTQRNTAMNYIDDAEFRNVPIEWR